MLMTKSILVLHGPNLNMLGQREPATYGHETLAEIDQRIAAHGAAAGVNVSCRQSNAEGELVGLIQGTLGTADGLLMNAGAYTHTSIAIHDAIRAAGVPTIEVHLSNVHAREVFRHQSYVSPVAIGVICGFGAMSYILALDAMIDFLSRSKSDA